MHTQTPTLTDWLFLVLFIALALMFIFQAYVNFVKNEISTFSYDALAFFLALRFSKNNSSKNIRKKKTDIIKIRRFGIYALLGAAGSIYEIVKWMSKYQLK
jgi:hypothetical protein